MNKDKEGVSLVWNTVKVKIEKIIPLYAILPLLSAFMLNNVVYFVIRLFAEDKFHYDFTTDFDRMVPFVPAWVSIYFLCYVFWIANYILIGRQDKRHFYGFITAEIISKTICGLFFFFLPTTNVRPEVIGSGIWEQLMRLLYSIDAPTNLFPSIHCLESWFCYRFICGRASVPKFYQRFSGVFAVLVILSTQFTKQHYIVDVFGGVLLAEICYQLCTRTGLYKPVMKFFERITHGKQKEKYI